MSRNDSPLSEYEKYRDQMKSGDVIAFSGNGNFSKLIKWATRSNYSHVGIVLKLDLGGGFGKSLLLVESTLLTDLANYDNKPAIRGVQMQWLSKRLQMYNGDAWWIPLKQSLPEYNLRKMQAWLRQTYNKQTPYDETQIMGVAIDVLADFKLVENKEDFSQIFCSELVTKALKVASVVSESVNASEQTPQDVVNFPCLQAPPIRLK
jgi:hypothetical protein